MMTRILRHRRTGRCRPIAFALLPTLALVLASLAAPARADLSRWTPPANWAQGDQNRYAVHMM